MVLTLEGALAFPGGIPFSRSEWARECAFPAGSWVMLLLVQGPPPEAC